jgi:D-alanyl-D-alanine carboxypeptidase (penicillin-binding protein 5/6)
MINSRAAMLVDAETGQVIYQQNADQQLPVASVSKLLAACVIEDEIASHQLHWQQKVKINKAVAAVSCDPNYSAIGLQAGQSYTVRDLFDAMLVKSADGAALALSTANGGTIKQFNAKMAKKARQIGLKDVKVVNAVGLRNGDLKQLRQPKIGKNAGKRHECSRRGNLDPLFAETLPVDSPCHQPPTAKLYDCVGTSSDG